MKIPLDYQELYRMTPTNRVAIDLYARKIAVVKDGVVEYFALDRAELEAYITLINQRISK